MCFCCCFISVFKGAYTLFLLYYFFNFNGKQGNVKYFSEKRVRWCYEKIVISKTALQKFFLVQYFMKTDQMKPLWTISDSKIQICGVKAVYMLLGHLFCFKVTDQIKYSINESLIILDIGQWILVLKSNVSLECTKYFRDTYYGYK